MFGIVPIIGFDEELAARVVELDEDGGGVRGLELVEHAERVQHVRDGRVVPAVHRELGPGTLHSRVLLVPHDVRQVRAAVALQVPGAAAFARVDRVLKVEHHVAQQLARPEANHLLVARLEVPLMLGDVVEVGYATVHPCGLRHVVRHLQ